MSDYGEADSEHRQGSPPRNLCWVCWRKCWSLNILPYTNTELLPKNVAHTSANNGFIPLKLPIKFTSVIIKQIPDFLPNSTELLVTKIWGFGCHQRDTVTSGSPKWEGLVCYDCISEGRTNSPHYHGRRERNCVSFIFLPWHWWQTGPYEISSRIDTIQDTREDIPLKNKN